MDSAQLADWVEAYERAWRSPGTKALAELFTEDASYSTTPYAEPHRGLDSIREMWEAERNPGEEFSMESEILAVEGDRGVVRLRVQYRKPRDQEYRDLWIVHLDGDGRCTEFEEWPFWPPGSQGAAAGGA
jgi:ketosteroid isomerase-like protein